MFPLKINNIFGIRLWILLVNSKKLNVFIFKSQLGSNLDSGTEASNFRHFINYLGSFIQHTDESVLVRAKIYIECV